MIDIPFGNELALFYIEDENRTSFSIYMNENGVMFIANEVATDEKTCKNLEKQGYSIKDTFLVKVAEFDGDGKTPVTQEQARLIMERYRDGEPSARDINTQLPEHPAHRFNAENPDRATAQSHLRAMAFGENASSPTEEVKISPASKGPALG